MSKRIVIHGWQTKNKNYWPLCEKKDSERSMVLTMNKAAVTCKKCLKKLESK